MAISERSVEIGVGGVQLVGAFYFPNQPGEHPVIIVCHGMPAGPQSTSGAEPQSDDGVTYPDFATVCAERGVAALIFNFRGTGESGGNFHAMGWAEDLRAMVDWAAVQPEARPDRIGVLGSSMGASVALHVAATDPRIAAIISFAAPASMGTSGNPEDMVRRMRATGIIRDSSFPPSIDEWYREFTDLNALAAIPAISPRRVVLIQGDVDDVVPPGDARLLFDRAGDPKDLVILPGVGHRFRREPMAVETCLDWIETTLLD
jgi:fermentation-respiration switch protein FrsA (DUF1100 family)